MRSRGLERTPELSKKAILERAYRRLPCPFIAANTADPSIVNATSQRRINWGEGRANSFLFLVLALSTRNLK